MNTSFLSLSAAFALGASNLILPTTAMAQTPPTKDPVQKRINEIAARLNLTPAQKEKLKPLRTKYQAAFEDLIDDDNLTRQEKIIDGMALAQRGLNEVRLILTPRQSEQLDAIIAGFIKQHGPALSQLQDAGFAVPGATVSP